MKNNLIKTCISMTIRSFIICIWVFSGITFAHKIKAQNLDQIHLSMNVDEASLTEIISQIQKHTLFTFFYQDVLLGSVDQKVSLNVKNMPLREILNRISSEFQLSYKQTDYTIALKKR